MDEMIQRLRDARAKTTVAMFPTLADWQAFCDEAYFHLPALLDRLSAAEQERAALAWPENFAPPPGLIPCCGCGTGVVEFSIPSPLWNAVIRPDGREHGHEYLCIACWHRAVAAALAAAEARVKELEGALDECRAFVACHAVSYSFHHELSKDGQTWHPEHKAFFDRISGLSAAARAEKEGERQ